MHRGLAMAVLALSALACSHLKGPVGLGEVLDFELSDLEGERVRLRDHRGQVVLVAFWAPWCRPCAEELPRLSDLYTRLQAEGLEVLAVAAQSSAEEVDAFLDGQALPFPSLFDPDARLMQRLGLFDIPSWVLVDAYGRVVHVHAATPDDAFWRLEWVVRRGLGQPELAPANARPVRPAKSDMASGASSL